MKKDIFRVFTSNIIKMFVTLMTAFVVPKVLSIESYGYLKEFQFYVSYLGVSHLGYCDGIYLEYGGECLEKLNKEKLAIEKATLLMYETVIALTMVLVGLLVKNYIIIFLGLYIVPTVMFTFYTFLFQATGELKKYTSLLNTTTILNLIINVGLVISNTTNYKNYIVCYCLTQWVSYFLAKKFYVTYNVEHQYFSFAVLKKYIKYGFLLMIGNFIYSIFLGIDKWFIRFSLDITDFSMYSFSSQMITVINMFVSPIAMTLYSNLSRRKNQAFEIKIKKIITVLLFSVPLLTSGIEIIIKFFLQEYIEAIGIIKILMISQIFLVLNIAIFVNLYKTYKKTNQYFVRLCISLGIALLLNFIVLYIRPELKNYAMATMISCLIWLILNIQYFKYMRPGKKELCFVCVLLGVYVLTLALNLWSRVLIYFICYVASIRCLMTDVWVYVINIFKQVIDRVLKV